MVSTGLPKELKNYIIKSDKIEKAYKNLKDDFKMYKIDIRGAFSMGDALFVDNVYYLESVENLQLTMRCKNSRIANINSDLNSLIPLFRYYLKVSLDVDTDYIMLEPVNQSAFGKETDRYRYFVLSFDDVKIEYAKTKVELYVFMNDSDDEAAFDEDDYKARFTLFDVNMPKTKLQAKKFKLD